MYNLITIGDPVLDTHVQLDDGSGRVEKIGGTEYLCFEYGAKIPIIDSFQSLGGNAANVAVAAAKLGLRTALVSTVGADSAGKTVVEELARYGVDTGYVTADRTTKTRYSIILNYQKERTILSYSELRRYAWPQPFPETEWLYYTGVRNGHEKLHAAVRAHVLKHKTVRLAINPGSYLLKYAPDDARELISRADALIVNVQEAEKILKPTDSLLSADHTPLPPSQGGNAAALVRELVALGAKEVIVTDGANGAWAGDANETWHLPSFPVAVVAKTGAGDAFSAGYLAARLNRHDIPHALQWGVANSCSVIAEHGPHAGLLNEKGIKQLIKKYSAIKLTQLF